MTNPENAIEVRDVRKKFRIFYDRSNDLKDRILFRNRNHYEDRWVLNGISFSVRKGEAIGLVGHNGCGKSTTLKLLSRILYPDAGSIEMQGRVSSLIELGAGFHPDMTGRENIYTNASIFGLTRREIEKRIADIINFSELEQFIDNPVRTYSSGMYMRLAFSVAIHVDAKILLIDEILAVGDANFQKKCFDKLREIKSHGTTIVIVSHALGQIEQICDTSYWIEDGLIRESGIPKTVHDHYLKHMEDKRTEHLEHQHAQEQQSGNRENPENPENPENSENPALPAFCEKTAVRMGTQQVIFTNAELRDQDNQKQFIFDAEQEIKIFLQYHAEHAGDLNLKGNFGYGIFREDGLHCYGTNILIESGDYIPIREDGQLEITFRNALLPARYFLDIAVHSHDGVIYDDIRRVLSFVVSSGKQDIGVCRLQTEFSWR